MRLGISFISLLFNICCFVALAIIVVVVVVVVVVVGVFGLSPWRCFNNDRSCVMVA